MREPKKRGARATKIAGVKEMKGGLKRVESGMKNCSGRNVKDEGGFSSPENLIGLKARREIIIKGRVGKA